MCILVNVCWICPGFALLIFLLAIKEKLSDYVTGILQLQWQPPTLQNPSQRPEKDSMPRDSVFIEYTSVLFPPLVSLSPVKKFLSFIPGTWILLYMFSQVEWSTLSSNVLQASENESLQHAPKNNLRCNLSPLLDAAASLQETVRCPWGKN